MNKIKKKIKKVKSVYQSEGIFYTIKFILKKILLSPQPHETESFQSLSRYETWVRYNQWTKTAEMRLRVRLSKLTTHPKISVIMPVYNTPPEYLENAIKSVVEQIYPNWELCIADDCSTESSVHQILQQWQERDNRIKVFSRKTNGNISNATNDAASIASGDFMVFLDHDDLFTINALAEVAYYISLHPETDFLYSDEDKIDASGQQYYDPHFKPDWSPELLLSYMYIGHIWGVRPSIYQQIGGMRESFEGSQDYDFALRATEVCKHIAHLPLVLYHWRAIPGSTAVSGKEKPKSFEAGIKAVQETLDRRKIEASAVHPLWASEKGLGAYTHHFPDQGPEVTIIIATKNEYKVLKTCIDSLTKTTYQNYNVLIIDNESDDPETLAYLKICNHRVVRIANPTGKFNYAAIHNIAVRNFVDTDYILFLNNDTEVINPEWLSQMVGYCLIEGVGAVGAKLIYPDKRIQHGGVIHGLHHGLAGHAFKLHPSESIGYGLYLNVPRNYSAVTAACLLTSKQLFLQVEGFDQENFAVAYNDVDLCYKIRAQKKRIVFCPDATLIHYEGLSRGFNDNPKETAFFKKKYSEMKDPFFNPNFSLESEGFEINPRRLTTEDLSETKLRVLVCTHMLNFTGAPLHQYEIISKLKKENKIEPIVLSMADGPLKPLYQEQGIEVVVFQNLYSHYNPAEFLVGNIAHYNADLLYANTLETFAFIHCAKILNLPSIWNIHESLWENYINHIPMATAYQIKECFTYPYKTIFVADATRKAYQCFNSNHNFITIHNGLDQERITKLSENIDREEARSLLGIQKDDIMVLSLGTVCDRKGQIDLVQAFPLLQSNIQHKVKIVIVGDRPSDYSTRLRQLVDALPKEQQKQIQVIPETSQVVPYYRAADIFVLSSREESFPRVIQEAMAFHLPIIATPVFGVVEQIKNNTNGFFYEPEDCSKLAHNISKLVEEDALRKQMGHNSHFVLQTLTDFDSMTEQYLQAFYEASYFKKVYVPD